MNSNDPMLGGAGALPRAPLEPSLAALDLVKLGTGLALSALYGLALGARGSGLDLLRHALGAPLALLVLAALSMPSLVVLFALLDAPITPSALFMNIARAVSGAGLVLSGLAPGAALFVVTTEASGLVTTLGRLGCMLAFGLAFSGLFATFWRMLGEAPEGTRLKARGLLCAYSLFVGMLAMRLFTTFLPLLGGAS